MVDMTTAHRGAMARLSREPLPNVHTRRCQNAKQVSRIERCCGFESAEPPTGNHSGQEGHSHGSTEP